MRLTIALRVVLFSAVVGFAAMLAYAVKNRVDHDAEARFSRNLRSMKAIDAELNENVLKARSGLASHYDSIEEGIRTLRNLNKTLMRIPAFFSAPRAEPLRLELERNAKLIQEKGKLLEGFESHNAVLRNSLRYLPIAAEHSAERETSALAVGLLRSLVGDVLVLDVTPGKDARDRARDRIAELERLQDKPDTLSDSEGLAVVLRHAKVVEEREPVVDGFVARILAEPVAASVNRMEDAYQRLYQDALAASAARERVLLGFVFVIAVLGMTDVILRVKGANAALAKASRELRAANEALEQEQKKERELGELKTRFVSMTSHEFRTPLSSILSSSELLQRYGNKWDADRRSVHLERIRGSAVAMSNMLDEILVIGRAEAGALKASPAPMQLDRFCHDLAETVSKALGRSGAISVSFSGDADVVLDERLLGHVLSNLLENALKYSPPHSDVRLEIHSSTSECRFVVKDSGIGIPADDLPRLFTSYVRGKNVGQVAGTGLGLAVVRRAVDVQGGSIDVKSEVGRGSEFSVRLPRGVSDAAPPTVQAS